MAAESGTSSRIMSGGETPASIESLVRSDRVTLRTGGRTPVVIGVRRAASSVGGTERGAIAALSLRLDGAMGDVGDYAIGVTAAAARGEPRSVGYYEPRLPGEFGLRSLNTTGTRWYARVRAALPSGLGLSVRVGGGPDRGMSELGVGLDARG